MALRLASVERCGVNFDSGVRVFPSLMERLFGPFALPGNRGIGSHRMAVSLKSKVLRSLIPSSQPTAVRRPSGENDSPHLKGDSSFFHNSASSFAATLQVSVSHCSSPFVAPVTRNFPAGENFATLTASGNRRTDRKPFASHSQTLVPEAVTRSSPTGEKATEPR